MKATKADQFIAKGDKYFATDQEKAIRNYQEALKNTPEYPQSVHRNIGLCQQQLGRFDEALQSFDAALGIDPNYVDALHNKAQAHQSLGQYRQAMVSIEGAVGLGIETNHPHLEFICHNKGEILRESGRYGEALGVYNQMQGEYGNAHGTYIADNIKGITEDWQQRADKFLHDGHLENALKDYNGLIASDFNDPIAHDGKGRALHALGRSAEARISFDMAIALDGDNLEFKAHRALTMQAPASQLEGGGVNVDGRISRSNSRDSVTSV